jgi:hypothetical protein
MAGRRNDDAPSIASRTENRWMPRDDDKPAASTKIMPNASFGEEQNR